MPLNLRQLFFFALVGAIGFGVNALILQTALLSMGPVAAQLIAFPFAITVTWWLNRRYTFTSTRPWRAEWMLYIAGNFVGWLVTNGTYLALVLYSSVMCKLPIAALGIAAVAGLFFNFAASKWIIFRSD